MVQTGQVKDACPVFCFSFMSKIERTPVGRIVGAFGIKGQVKVEMITSFESRFDAGTTLFIEDKPYKIEASQFHKGRPLLKLSGISTMSEAELLQWKILDAEGEPDMEDDEFLIEDLIGLKVITVEGEDLGVVDDIEDNPAHEIVVVGEIRFPLIDHFVKDIDVEKGTMTVQLIYGMKPGEE